MSSAMTPGDLHDGELLGLTYEPSKAIRLSFLTDGGVKIVVTLRGVQRFRGNDFRDGNIVLDVCSTKFGNLNFERAIEAVKRTFAEEFSAEPAVRALACKPQWEKWFAEIEAGDLHVFVVEPSYGAEIVAVCSDVEIT